jgi:predicted esterase
MQSGEDEKGMRQSVQKVHGIIKEQMDKGIASDRIILGGFSQGGAIALLVCYHTQSYQVVFVLIFTAL